MQPLSSEVLAEIDVLVRSGVWDVQRIFEIVCEELYEPGQLNEDAVRAAIASNINEWRASQAEWPAVTDCDRLDTAFDRLNNGGVIAMHNAGMTQSDGYDDFQLVYSRHPKPHEVIGYCFYHGQDLARVVRGGPLYFAFGPCDPHREELLGPQVGQVIVQELSDVGLVTEWPGTFNQRILIPHFNWQRRAPSK
jgi:hypothetical protein